MPEFRIQIDIGHLIPEGAPVNADLFPNLAHAVRRIAEGVMFQWQSVALGQQPLPNGERIKTQTGQYARSIDLRETGPFAAEVYTDLRYAQYIEEGSPEYDQKQILSSSYKVRTGPRGRYLIIPFRHYHPNAVIGRPMPPALWGWWHRMGNREPSEIRGRYERVSGTGAFDIRTRQPATVPGWHYRWGARVTRSELDELGILGREARRLEGMVQFRKPGGSGGYGQHAQFMTFRVMSESSRGWIRPAQPGKHVAKQIAEATAPLAEEQFRLAVQADIAGLLGGGRST